jgi:hypothetical protein
MLATYTPTRSNFAGRHLLSILDPRMKHICMTCLLLAMARVSTAQSSSTSVSPAVVAVVSLLGAAGGLILMSLLVSSAWKRYQIWRDEPAVNREHVMDQMHRRDAPGTIPFSDIEFQGADLYRFLQSDAIQMTPRSIDKKR